MATSNDETDYEVGYGKPPAATQFKPGRSGNPRGRPPKSKSLQNLVVKVLGEKHRLKDQPRGARVCYTALEVVMLTLKAMAARGHDRATKLYTTWLEKHGRNLPVKRACYIVVPELLTREEWEARYSPKDAPPAGDGPG